MISLRNIALAFLLGAAPVSSIVTNQSACAEEAPFALPSPLSASREESLEELALVRSKLIAFRDGREAELGTVEGAMDTLEKAWKESGRKGEFPKAAAGKAAQYLNDVWAVHAKGYRQAVCGQPLAMLDGALVEAKAFGLRPGQIACLRIDQVEWTRRVISLNSHLNRQIDVTVQQLADAVEIDTTASEKDPAPARKLEETRLADLEALGTTRFPEIYTALAADVEGRFSRSFPSLGEEPSGTRLEVLYWRLAQRRAQLGATVFRNFDVSVVAIDLKHVLAKEKGFEERVAISEELARELGIDPVVRIPTLYDRATDAKARMMLWNAVDELRATDARAMELVIEIARCRLALWMEACDVIGRIDPTTDCWGMKAKERARRLEILEDGVLRLMALAGLPPAKLVDRVPEDEELEKTLRLFVLSAAGSMRTTLSRLGEKDATLEGIYKAAADGSLGLNSGRDGSGVCEVYSEAMDELDRTIADRAFRNAAGKASWLTQEDAAMLKGGKLEELKKVEKFWSTQEVMDRLHKAGSKASEQDAARIAEMLQVERLARELVR